MTLHDATVNLQNAIKALKIASASLKRAREQSIKKPILTLVKTEKAPVSQPIGGSA